MRDETMKSWRCNNGHIMGMVLRKNRVRQLLLLRVALDFHPGEDELDVMAVVEGYVADVTCSICGNMRTWVPGREAMRRLMRQERNEVRDG